MMALHWQEVERDQGDVAFAPLWDSWRRYEKDGMLRIAVVRIAGRMVGYNGFMVHRGLLFGHTLIASNVGVYVEPEHRGWPGLKLIRESERMLAVLDHTVRVSYAIKPYVHIGAKSGTLGTLLGRLGYRHDEEVFTKLVRG